MQCMWVKEDAYLMRMDQVCVYLHFLSFGGVSLYSTVLLMEFDSFEVSVTKGRKVLLHNH